MPKATVWLPPVIEFDPVIFPVIKLVMNDSPASLLLLFYF
jgi:hypothetical protein